MLPKPSIFMQESQPTESEVADTLGETKAYLDELIQHVLDKSDKAWELWKRTTKKYGWGLRLGIKKRTIIYLTPHDGSFTAGFILGAKAVDAAMQSKLTAKVKQEIENGPQYPEGRGVRLEVKKPHLVKHLKTLIDIKINN